MPPQRRRRARVRQEPHGRAAGAEQDRVQGAGHSRDRAARREAHLPPEDAHARDRARRREDYHRPGAGGPASRLEREGPREGLQVFVGVLRAGQFLLLPGCSSR